MQTTKIKIHRILICCSALSMVFISINSKELEARYWFDSDFGNVNTCMVESGGIELSLPEEGLPNRAIHQLNFQIKDSNGQWSGIYSGLFTVGQTPSLNLSYDIDGRGVYTSVDMDNPQIYGEELVDGAHHITVVDNNGNVMPANRLFFKNSTIGNNLTLSLESSRDSVRKAIQIPADTKEVEVDVSDLTVGIYPMTANFKGAQSQLLQGVSSLVNIRPVGGERVTGICYWLNDSVGESKEILIPEGEMPFSYSVDLDMSDLSVPTADYSVMVDSLGLKVTPNYNVGVAVMSNRGFRADTTAYYKDNGKVESVVPVILQSDVQHDFGKVSPQDVLWTQIPVQENDRVQFMPRWESTVKLFDDTASAVDTTVFDDSVIKTTFTSASTGNYYAQIYDIAESVRDFSVKMKYLDGPSASNPESLDTNYEGIPIEWKSIANWNTTEESIALTVKDITLAVNRGSGQFIPEVAERNGVCIINEGNSIIFNTPAGYLDKITLCVPIGYGIPEVRALEGDVTIDRDANIVVWEGLSKCVELTVKDYYTSDIADNNQIAEIMLEKAYVRISEISEDQYEDVSDIPEIPEDFDYTAYNYLRVWDSGNKVGEYELTENTTLTFSENDVIVINNGTQTNHPITDHLILTYSYEPGLSGVDVVETEKPTVEIYGDNIIFSGLPSFVGVYTLDGRIIFQGQVDDPDFSYPVRDLIPGIYIIKVGTSSTKMIIK